MKKILLIFLACGAFIGAQAQPFFSESFDTEIPATWTIIDVDGYTSSTSQSAYASWAWNSGLQDASSSSWYDNSGTGPTDDWLITPQISVPASGVNSLTFFGSSHEANYLEEYEVLVSTTGTNTTDFTNNILSVTDEAEAGTTHSIDISSFNGQNIYIAFHHISNDESILHIDDVECATLPNNDLEVTNISVDNRIEGNKSFTVEVTNNGINTATAFDLDWDFDGSAVTTENITGISLTTGQTHDVQVTVNGVTAGLAKTFNAEITTSDDDNSNNLLSDDFNFFEPVPQYVRTDSKGNNFDLHQRLSEGQAIILDFMASWCTPCQNSTPELSELIENNGSGNGPIQALAITIESTDDDAALNGLNWNGGFYEYPKFSYDNSSYETSNPFQYSYYENDHGLGNNGIPFFVMICPNPSDPGNSTIVQSDVGFSSGMFNAYQTELDNCSTATFDATGINENAVTEFAVYPNPAVTSTNVQFELSTATNVAIELVNTLGQVVYTNNLGEVNGAQKIEIETSHLEGGMYFVNLNLDGEIITKRISVRK